MLVCLGHAVHGQDTLLISKTELMERVAENNYMIKSAIKDTEMAQADLNQTRSLYLPFVSASYIAMKTTNPLMAFGSKLNQQRITQADFNPVLLNDPDAIENYSTQVDIMQPLLNMDGIKAQKAARIQYDAMALKAERTREYMDFEVVKAYMQLQLGYSALEVLERATFTAQEGLNLVNNYYDQGMVQKADVLSVEVRVNEVQKQLNYARSNTRNGSDYLALLMGEEISTKIYKPVDDISKNKEDQNFNTIVPASRKDIQAMELAVQGYEKMFESGKMKLLPRINAFGNYQFNDNQLLGFNTSGYLVGLNLSWDIFDGYKSLGSIQKAKAEYEKSQVENDQFKNQSQLELNQAQRQYMVAKQSIKLSEVAFEQSSEAYRIKSDRFKQGLEKTADLLQAETKMYQKELELKQSIFEYELAKEYLKFLTK